VFAKKENLIDDVSGIKDSEWLLVGNWLNWIDVGKDND